MSSINLNNDLFANLDYHPEKSGRIELDSEGAEEGLAQLVLTIIELLRQLVERQAIRRVEGGNLTEDEMEELGVALMNLDVKMDELKEIFNLDDNDLNIDLGPLGNLL
ncbi:gas vesicle protein K [Gracilibacillus sp. D59]|uniref:gas vesicle protein K n=1 Tax=Gracilibacillus sp. D59 TaxID=3457434 RepID=UPI003FCEDAB0